MNGCPFLFTVKAASYCRVLKLDDTFLVDQANVIDNLEDTVNFAYEMLEDFGGPPILDYKKFRKVRPHWKVLVKEVFRRSKVVSSLEHDHRNKFFTIMKRMKDHMNANI